MKRKTKQKPSVLAVKMTAALRKRIKAAADRSEQTESGFIRLHIGRVAETILGGNQP